MNRREKIFRRLREGADVPVLILGGGINGAGLLRELALQGVDCLLVDKSDFVAGASSKSSRMIHGGLRYLERREFHLVRESLFERNRLLDNAPHVVTPLKTTIPLTSRLGGLLRSALIFLGLPVRPGERGVVPVKVGLWFYDFITRKDRHTPTHRLTRCGEALRAMPGLRTDIVATATYWDAWISQAERLCVEIIQDARAAHAGCEALNYVRPTGLEDGAVALEDRVTGETIRLRPRVLVNATGAWVDLTNAALGTETRFLGGTKGSHLVIDCEPLRASLDGQMVYYQHRDGRVCIVFPFADKVIMGSTDLRVDDPDEAHCDADEIAYMFETLRGVFPHVGLSRKDIVHVFCGVRPLPRAEGQVLANVSRGHSLRTIEPEGDRPFPIVCLIGGKWTTFRRFAEETADDVLARLGRTRQHSTEHLPIGGGRDFPVGEARRADWIARVAGHSGVSPERVAVLLSRYGTVAEDFAAAEADDERRLETLGDYTLAEIARIAATEDVEHLADLICRRSTIALLGQATEPVLRELASVIGAALGWKNATMEREVADALAEVRLP